MKSYARIIFKNGLILDFNFKATYIRENKKTFDILTEKKDNEKTEILACIPIENVLYIEWM